MGHPGISGVLGHASSPGRSGILSCVVIPRQPKKCAAFRSIRVLSPRNPPRVSDQTAGRLSRALDEHYDEILPTWIAQQKSIISRAAISEGDLRVQCSDFLTAMRGALGSGADDLEGGRGPAS